MPPPSYAVISPGLEDTLNGKPLEKSGVVLKLILDTYTITNAASVLESFLYGIHCILFTICCYILVKKRRHTTSLVFLAAAIIMFGLSTADFSLTLRMQLADAPRLLQGEMNLNEVVKRALPKGQIFVANNLIADLLLLYRCSLVWNFRRSVLAVSVLLLLGDTVWGWVGGGISKAYIATSWEKFTTAYSWSIFCMNIIMTILIIGRLWWVIKHTRPRLGPRDRRIYHTVIVVFAETALIYSICVLLTVVIPKSNRYIALSVVATIRLVSIMPTLLIVQIAGGRSFDDRFKKSTIEDTERPITNPYNTSLMLDTIIATRASAGNGDIQEVPPEEHKPSSSGTNA